jgi:FtsZ-binding cell division protein ZapB
MKQKVIKFLQNLPKEKYDQFNEAFELYRKSEGKNFGVERTINASGFSERVLENLLYDLQKLHGITDVEKVSVQMAVVIDYPESIHTNTEGVHTNTEAVHTNTEGSFGKFLVGELEASTEPIDTNTEAVHTTTEPLVNDDAVNALVQENQNLVSEKEDLEFEKEELEEENEGLKDELETLKSLPKIDAKSIRVEFPFLNDKNCPDEFKILIADKITAWNSYLEFQDKIKKAESGEEPQSNEVLEILAKEVIQFFDENQKIYDELNAYQTTGKVLGLHPIFKKLQLTREVEEMTADELVKYKSSSAKYFTDNRQSLAKAEKAKNTEKIELITNRVAERELKLALVNKKLGINPK